MHNQAIEYLEFLLDDPPINEGYGKTHVLALLALVYEQAGDQYGVVLAKTYEDMQDSHTQDLAAGKRPLTNQKKIEQRLSKKSIGESSEVFEMLALQALDRCEYVIAAEFLQQAVDKAPNKAKMLHLLAEVLCILGHKDRAAKYAERAFVLQPQSAELRNLLLVVAPGKWQDKLRAAAALGRANMKEEDKDSSNRLQKAQSDDPGEANFFSLLGDTLKSVQKDGVPALFSSASSGGNPEQRAKAAAEKERKRKEKQKRKEKKEAEAAEVEKVQKRNWRKRDPEIDGPAKPPKPLPTNEATRIINLARSGNKNIHFYDPTLQILAAIREKIVRDETEGMRWIERIKAKPHTRASHT